jgi:hypothetical protein
MSISEIFQRKNQPSLQPEKSPKQRTKSVLTSSEKSATKLNKLPGKISNQQPATGHLYALLTSAIRLLMSACMDLLSCSKIRTYVLVCYPHMCDLLYGSVRSTRVVCTTQLACFPSSPHVRPLSSSAAAFSSTRVASFPAKNKDRKTRKP